MINKKIKKVNLINKLINNILRDIDFNNELFYFNFLNLIRPHDIFLKKYLVFFNTSKFYVSKFVFLAFIKFILTSIFNLFFSIRKTNFELPKDTKLLLISHLVNKSDEKNDRYFNELDNILVKNDIYYSKIFFNYQTNNFYSKNKNNLIINKHGDFFLETKVIFKQINLLFNYYKFRNKLIQKKKRVIYNFYNLFLVSILSNECRNNIRFSMIIKKVIKKNKSIKNFICTLEGHNWEKIAFTSLKQNNTNIKTIGYTTTLIFKDQKIISNENKFYSNPDLIFTNCENNKEIISKKYHKNNIVNIGNLNFKQFEINNLLKNKLEINKVCLVLPENIDSEFYYFLNFINKYLLKYDNLKFNIKIHPGMKNNKKINKIINKNYNNKIYYSFDKINEQIFNADYVLYRGSSSILIPLLLNKRIIYLNDKKGFYINPLHKNANSIENISNPDHLYKITILKNNINYDFTHKYIEKPKIQKILSFLS
tara:strand:- start:1722 stop:3164 length:1443 start_codon:yes stop_codon:yes gene_type:complete